MHRIGNLHVHSPQIVFFSQNIHVIFAIVAQVSESLLHNLVSKWDPNKEQLTLNVVKWNKLCFSFHFINDEHCDSNNTADRDDWEIYLEKYLW